MEEGNKNMNVVMKTLIQRKESLEQEVAGLVDTQRVILQDRATTLLQPALSYLPEAEVSYGYDTFRVMIDRKELISINERTYYREEPSYYLSTYATTVDTEFEFKRLVLNGKLAGLILDQPTLCPTLFAETSVDGAIKDLREERYALERAIREAENKEEADKLAAVLKSFESGNEIEFTSPRCFSYARGRFDTLNRVVKIKMNAQFKGGKVDMDVFYQGYPADTILVQNLCCVKMKYVHNFLYENLANMPA